MKTCQHCGDPFSGEGKGYCSYDCHNASKRAATVKANPCVPCLYRIGIGCAKISERLGIAKATARAVLIHLGIYEPGKLWSVRLEKAARRRAAIAVKPPKPPPLTKEELNARQRAKYQERREELLPRMRASAKRRYEEKKSVQEWVDRRKESRRNWFKRNPEVLKAWHRKWAQEKPESYLLHRLASNLRGRLSDFVKHEYRSLRTQEMTGCDAKFLKQWLESKFTEGMSWKTYGPKGWHIDHILPCASFDLRDLEQQKKCFHYTNLQPLWWHENLKKSDSIAAVQPELAIAI